MWDGRCRRTAARSHPRLVHLRSFALLSSLRALMSWLPASLTEPHQLATGISTARHVCSRALKAVSAEMFRKYPVLGSKSRDNYLVKIQTMLYQAAVKTFIFHTSCHSRVNSLYVARYGPSTISTQTNRTEGLYINRVCHGFGLSANCDHYTHKPFNQHMALRASSRAPRG